MRKPYVPPTGSTSTRRVLAAAAWTRCIWRSSIETSGPEDHLWAAHASACRYGAMSRIATAPVSSADCYSQPASVAMRMAAMRLRASSLAIALER